ncbi:S49 family peptidase [Candidatus Pacearchaeota archaeon]|jgi:signal peptide peptidase SppA|nr:S49 family peptidase [Candidatus Pacearchaeota archaeon]
MRRDSTLPGVLAEWAAEPWAMEPARCEALFARLSPLADRIEALSRIEVTREPPKLNIVDGVAVIPISGILLKSVPPWLAFFGIDASSYGQIASLVNQAVASPQVASIRLEVDSPGGTIAGLLEAARAIRMARDSKPVTARVQDLAASAAYWLASQAGSIRADLNAEVGSIGVYMVYYDMSKMAAEEGVTVHVIASGEHKGMGVPGAPITDLQIAATREVIEGIADNFIAAVADGRGMAPAEARALATGRLWEAKAALANKLIDRLGEEPALSLSSTPNSQSSITSIGESSMEPQKNELPAVDAAASEAKGREAERGKLAEFKAAFPNDLEFAVASYESGVTVEQAKASYAIWQKRAARAETATGADGRIGAQRSEGNESAQEGPDFMAASRQYAAEHKCSMTEAMKAVQAKDPALHERFLEAAETNARPVKKGKDRVTI